MRSSKGTAQFLLVAFFILAALVYACNKNDKHPSDTVNKTASPAPSAKDDIDD
jgi:hypothetical protein